MMHTHQPPPRPDETQQARPRIISYSRVSTSDQAESGTSLDAQPARIASYCNLYRLDIVATLSDPGVSAKSLRRPGIQRAIQMCQNDEADGICVVDLSRLTRSVRDWQFLMDNFFGEKAKYPKLLFCIDDSINTKTASGRMVLNVLMAVQQFQREQTGEKTKYTLRHKMSKHERMGRVPFGFDVAPADGKTLVPNEREQEAIAAMKELQADGCSLRTIAEEMLRQGVRGRNGKPLGPTTIRVILNRVIDQDSAA